MRDRTRILLTTIVVAGVPLAGCEQPLATPDVAEAAVRTDVRGHEHHAARVGGADADVLAAMRAGTARYQRFEEAVADGFVPLSECVAAPWGGMGYHYGRPDRLMDDVVDASAPEVLLYEPTKNGRMRLVGVEFLMHDDAWTAAGNSAAPALAGQTFDPPNPNHPDAAIRPFHTLHVWIWRDNPDGLFAPFNPGVSCDFAPHI
jgi:hypothetical protein